MTFIYSLIVVLAAFVLFRLLRRKNGEKSLSENTSIETDLTEDSLADRFYCFHLKGGRTTGGFITGKTKKQN